MKSGIYETEYGNACKYREGSETAYDLDAQKEIPIEYVDFDKFIKEIG